MPLYDYRCDACGVFEAWRRLAELDVPMSCLTCGSSVQRLFSPPNINLNSGRFPTRSKSLESPKIVKRKTWETSKSESQISKTSRPWMIGHAPERL
ncbi:MAG: zinc ribbon domain-containing protein [Cyanobacteria bacterium P01_A01_bin.123]